MERGTMNNDAERDSLAEAKADFRSTIKANLRWFANSGVMEPSDGKWGVAERIAVLEGNEAAGKMLESFPAWTDFPGGAVIEQRRPDCNFETALLFLLAGDVFQDTEYRNTAENILDFLYNRSGLLNRSLGDFPKASWNWSHICWKPALWFDDNGWVAALQMLIGSRWPELDRKHHCREWGLKLAEALRPAMERCLAAFKDTPPIFSEQVEAHYDPQKIWLGAVDRPHWSMPVVAALLAADRLAPNPENERVAAECFMRLDKYFDTMNLSELTYAAMISPLAAAQWQNPVFAKIAFLTEKRLDAAIAASPDGLLPAEHREAPAGARLADLIYTLNWAIHGFINLARFNPNGPSLAHRNRLAHFLAEIQDKNPSEKTYGCWRGMFDLSTGQWGGGNRFEGGAGSIYSGWTNAPICLAFIMMQFDLDWQGMF